MQKNNILLVGACDKNYIEKTETALIKSLAHSAIFSDCFIICPQNDFESRLPIRLGDFSYNTYSRFLLKELTNYVEGDFCITAQWDSCIINPSYWSDDFLDFDYIGAVWPNNFPNRVGNGGFALRSKKFLDLCSKIEYSGIGIAGNEDFLACVKHYDFMIKNGVKFAPPEVAVKFSVEHPVPEHWHDYYDIMTYNSFAFHGEFNVAGMQYIQEI